MFLKSRSSLHNRLLGRRLLDTLKKLKKKNGLNLHQKCCKLLTILKLEHFALNFRRTPLDLSFGHFWCDYWWLNFFTQFLKFSYAFFQIIGCFEIIRIEIRLILAPWNNCDDDKSTHDIVPMIGKLCQKSFILLLPYTLIIIVGQITR